MKLSLFTSERDNEAQLAELKWSELDELFASPTRTACSPCPGSTCPGKLGPAWSPAIFAGTRAKKNVVEVSALVLDLDHLTSEDVNEIERKLADYQCIFHSSHSDRPNDRCLRAILAISQPVSAKDWPLFRQNALAELGVPADPATCDASRLYFLPSRPQDAFYTYASQTGITVDPSQLLATARKTSSPSPATLAPKTPVRNELSTSSEIVAELTFDRQAAATILARVWPERGRHYASLALAGALAHAGWSENEIADFLTTVASLVTGGDGEPAKRLAQASDSVRKCQAGEEVSGWPTLLDRGIPQFAVIRAAEWLDIPFSPVSNLSALLPSIMPAAITGAQLLSDVAVRESPPIRCYPTGFPELDQLLGGGLWTRRIAVLVAPPADGKSALAVALSLKIEIPVLYVSTELESEEIAARFAAVRTNETWRDLLSSSERKRLAVEGLPIHVIGAESIDRNSDEAIVNIHAEMQRLTAEYGTPPLLIVDYLQDLARGIDERSVRGKVGDLATVFRSISQTLDCPVLLISSVSRSYYGKSKADALRASDDATGYLAAAKESGDVDYAAAVVLFLDVEPASESKHRLARIAVAKSRLGRSGFAGARFFGATGRWEPDVTATVALAPEGRQQSKDTKLENEIRTKIMSVLREHPEGLSRKDLKDHLPHSTNKVANIIAVMRDKEHLIENVGLGNASRYILSRGIRNQT